MKLLRTLARVLSSQLAVSAREVSWSPRARRWGHSSILVLATAVISAGLLVPSPAPAAAATATAVTTDANVCESDPEACPPPPLLNRQLLTDANGFYFATAEQIASLRILEAEAVANTIHDFDLPASDAGAVKSWGRDQALAQLWALIVKAIRTSPGVRSNDQRNAVAWLAQVMNRKAKEIGLNAGWEYLKWAGRVSSADPRPSASSILADLKGFADGTLQPVNYMFGTADNSDSGYCDYVPPAGMEGMYDGNISKPFSEAGAWCFPPYQCPDPLGCDNRQPSYEKFASFGEAHVSGDPAADVPFAASSRSVSSSLTLGGATLAAGLAGLGVGLALGASLGPLAVGASLGAALFPFATSLVGTVHLSASLPAITGFVTSYGTAVGPAYAGATAAASEVIGASAISASVASAVTIAVIAITIAVIKGIEVVEDAAVPGKLHALVVNALAGTPDLQAMLADATSLRGLFALFMRAAGPKPLPATCDNSQISSGGVVFGAGVPPLTCANLPTIPQGPDEYQFLVEPTDGGTTVVGPGVRSDTIEFLDQAMDATTAPVGQAWTNRARLAGNWLVTNLRFPDGTQAPASQTLEFTHSKSYPGGRWVTRLMRQPDGSVKFFSVPSSRQLDPDTCVSLGLCAVRDHLYLKQPSEAAGGWTPVRVSIVPAQRPQIAINSSANPLVGQPVTLSATESGDDVGPYTYEWYVEQADGLVSVCPAQQPYCDHEGPFSTKQIDFTWQGSGDFEVVLVVTDRSGRRVTTKKTISVGSVASQLTVNAPVDPLVNDPVTLSGSVKHAGASDTLHLKVEWGDGTSLQDTYDVHTPPACSDCNPDWIPRSSTEVDWTAKHVWNLPGTYEVVVTVTDQGGQYDRKYVAVTVDKRPQLLEVTPPGNLRLDQDPAHVTATGGGSSKPVAWESSSPSVCTVAPNPVQARVDGRSRVTATLSLVALGTCTLRATQEGDANHFAAVPVVISFEVSIGRQEIDFLDLADRVLFTTTAPFEMTVAGGRSEQPVQLTSPDPDVCRTSNVRRSRDPDTQRQQVVFTVTLVDFGDCAITATQGGTDVFTAADPVTGSFAVTRHLQPLYFFPLDAWYLPSTAPFPVTMTAGQSEVPTLFTTSTPMVCTVSETRQGRDEETTFRAYGSATVTLVGHGMCSITASQGGNDLYEPAVPVTQTFTVGRVAQAIDFALIAAHAVGDSFAVTVKGGASAQAVTLTSDTPSVCRVSGAVTSSVDGRSQTTATIVPDALGTCSITASQSGDIDYTAANPVQRSFAVTLLPGQVPPEIAIASGSHLLVAPVVGESVRYGGTISHAGSTDRQTLTIDWGDGTVIERRWTPPIFEQCSGCNPEIRSITAAELAWSATHTWAHAGKYNVTFTVVDANGNFDRINGIVEVGRTEQSMTFPTVADVTIDKLPFPVEVVGGPATSPVDVVSTTPQKCTVTGQVQSRVDGRAHVVATVSTIDLGTCALRATQGPDADYFAAPPVESSFTVVFGGQEIDFPDLGAGRYLTSAPFEIAVMGGRSVRQVELTNANPGVCTLSEVNYGEAANTRSLVTAVITLVGVGECQITASQNGTDAFSPAAPVTRSFAVTKHPQSIFVLPLPFGDQTAASTAPFPVSMTAGLSDVPTLFTSSTPQVCTVSETRQGRDEETSLRAYGAATVTLVGRGECSITASQDGNSVFEAAEPVTVTFSVGIPQVLAFPVIADLSLDVGPFSVEVVGGSADSPVELASTTPQVCTVSGSVQSRVNGRAHVEASVSTLDAGTCTLRATQGGDADYNAADPVTRSFEVLAGVQRAQVLNFPQQPDRTFADSGFLITVNGGESSQLVILSSLTPEVCSTYGFQHMRFGTTASVTAAVDLAGVGTCTLTATQAGTDLFRAAEPVTRSFAVGKAPQNLSMPPFGEISPSGSPTFGDAPLTVVVTGGASAEPVGVASATSEVCTVSGQVSSRDADADLATTTAKVTLVGAGTCSITASQAGTSRYAPAEPITRSFEVAKATQSISFPEIEGRAYGDEPFPVTVLGGASPAPVRLVSEQPAICTVSEGVQSHDDSRATVTAMVTVTAAGTCALTATQDGTDSYRAAQPVTREFTVAGIAQVVGFAAIDDRTYGDRPFAVLATGGGSGNPVVLSSKTPEVCGLDGFASTSSTGTSESSAFIVIRSSGTCTIAASQEGAGGYIAAEPVERSFMVAKAAQGLELAVIDDHTFGDAAFNVSATGGGSTQPVMLSSTTPAVCSVTGATVKLLSSGSCTVSASQGGDGNHLAAEPVERTFDVAKAAQSLGFEAIGDHTFGDPAFTVTVTGGGSTQPVTLASMTPSVCSVTGATVELVSPGNCTIAASQPGDANYLAAASIERSFVIAATQQPLTFAPLEQRTYGSPAFTVSATGGASTQPLTLTSTTGAVCTVTNPVQSRVDGLAITAATVTILAAGTCAITAAQGASGGYLAASDVVRSFTVAKAALSVTAEDKTMVLGGTAPALTVRYTGLTGSDTSAVVTGMTCQASDASGQPVGATTPVGSYPIRCAGGTAANYDISYVPGSLRVTYTFSGLIGYSSTAVNSIKAGATLSAQWTLRNAAGAFVSNPASFVSLTTTSMTCGGAIPTTGAAEVPPGVSALRYDVKKGTWTYNWRTPSSAAKTCQALTLNLADGTASTVLLKFK